MSIPEVVNDAGILLEPTDISTIASKMEEVLTNNELRSMLIEKGRRNIQNFTWTATAKKFETVFWQVV